MSVFIFILGIVLFLGLIVAHEYGHYIVAKRNGVEAEEFAVFFGPSIFKRKTKSGMMFRFNILPLGGYVKLKGEHDSDTAVGSYGAASLWAKTKIMIAGVSVNFVLAIFILIIVCLIGLPQILPNQFTIKSDEHITNTTTVVSSVIAGSPAAKAGIKSGDDIIAIGPKNQIQSLTPANTLQDLTKKFAGEQVEVEYNRNSVLHTTFAKLNAKKSNQTIYLGVEFASVGSGVSLIRYTWAAPIVALGFTKQAVVLTYQGLGKVFEGIGGIFAGVATHNHVAREHAQTTASSQVLGPYGLYVVTRAISRLGIQFMLLIIALISLTLAIINVLPIPALDGGRLWITLIFRLFRKKLTAHREEMINAVGMVCLMLIMCLTVYIDINRFH
jgi:regulator of sigma E protease